MSPVGGVGINLAIQDAIAAANLLAGPFPGKAPLSDCVAKSLLPDFIWPMMSSVSLGFLCGMGWRRLDFDGGLGNYEKDEFASGRGLKVANNANTPVGA